VEIYLFGTGTTDVGTLSGINNYVGSSTSTTTLIGGSGTGLTYNVTGAGSGNVDGTTTFSGVTDLTGGSGDDSFVLGLNGSISGTIDGGGHATSDTLDLSAKTGAIVIDVSGTGTTGVGTVIGINDYVGSGTTTELIGTSTGSTYTVTTAGSGDVDGMTTFSGVTRLIAGSGIDTLKGNNGTNDFTFTINGVDSGTVTGLTGGFSNIENLTGGSGNDTFVFTGTGRLSGNVVGGEPTTAPGDVLDLSSMSGALDIHQDGSVTGIIDGTFTGIETLKGNGAAGTTLTGTDAGETFTITGADAGTAGSLAFTGVGNLVGGSGNDTFTGNVGSSLSGTITDIGGAATLNGVLTTAGFYLDVDTMDIQADMNAGAGDVYLRAASGNITNVVPTKYTLSTNGTLSVITSDPLGKINLNLNVPGDIYLDSQQTITLDGFYNQANITNVTGASIINAAFDSILGGEFRTESGINYYIDPALFNQQLTLYSLTSPELKMPEDQMEETLGSYDTNRWYKLAGMGW
jgi:hypothetical protein